MRPPPDRGALLARLHRGGRQRGVHRPQRPGQDDAAKKPRPPGGPAWLQRALHAWPPTCCTIWPPRTPRIALARRLRRYTSPAILAIDEVGYLSYDARYADLLFEVVTRRYEQQRSILLTTNKAFGEWNQVFPNAGCVVTLVDRLLHRAEIVALEGKSYRLKEAQERAARKAKSAQTRRAKRANSHVATQRPTARVSADRSLRRGGRTALRVPPGAHRHL